MPKNHEQNTVKPNDIVLLVTGKDTPIYGALIVTPDRNGKVDIRNEGDSLFKAYNIHTGKPIVVYGQDGQSDTWGINKTGGFIQLEEDGRFHLHVKSIGDHPIQAFPESGNKYGLPLTLPEDLIKPEKTSSLDSNQQIVTTRESMMEHMLSAGISEEGIKVVKNYIQERENQQANLTSQQV